MKIFKDIDAQLLFNGTPTSSDVAVLLGGRGVSGEIARQAASDYHATKQGLKDYFNKIIICGSVPIHQPIVRHLLKMVPGTTTLAQDFKTTAREADYMKSILLENNVDENDIIFTENTSPHTGANFANIVAFIHDNGIQNANIYTTA